MIGTEDEHIVVKRDGDRDIKFIGKLTSSFESSRNDGSMFYSGSSDHWTELKLFETKSGKFICQRIERSSWGHLPDEHHACVCDTESEVFEFFGHGPIAKELYDWAGLESVIEID